MVQEKLGMVSKKMIPQELVDRGLAAYEAEGIKAHGYVCDVTDEEAVRSF